MYLFLYCESYLYFDISALSQFRIIEKDCLSENHETDIH